jgi:hypothetical protein
MKRKAKRTRRQLVLALASDPPIQWPDPTRAALIAALADLLIEAHLRDQGSQLEEDARDESENYR